MATLFDTIRVLVADGQYRISRHAAQRLTERGIMARQAEAGLSEGTLLVERPDDVPHPIVEVREALSDGTEFKAVWSYDAITGVATLVTVHFFDRGK